MPVRTRLRGAGTRQAPWPQASHISSHEASNATDKPASTRSPGPIGLSCKNIRASASTKAAADRCETATPLGTPVEPEVKMTHASSPTLTCGRARRGDREAVRAREARTLAGTVTWRRGPTTAVTAASEKTRSARSCGSSTSTGT